MRGVVPSAQDRVALRGAQNVEAADRPLRLARPPPPAARTSRSPSASTLVTIEQVGPIVEPQPQPLARHRHQAERIVRGIVPADLGQTQPAGLLRQAGAVDRIVLEHHQGVEQLAQSGEPLDLRQAQMLVRDQPRLAVLHLLQQAAQRLARAAACTRSGSVLMNSPTMLSMPAISGGRPATVTPNTTSSRPVRRPSRIAQAAWMKVFSVRPCWRACRVSAAVSGLAQLQGDLLGHHRRPPRIMRRQTGGLLQPRQSLLPGRDRGGAILRRDPGQIIPVRRHPRQPPSSPLCA